MTAPTAAQITADADSLIALAGWLNTLDSLVSTTVGPAALGLKLNTANFASDWAAAGSKAPANAQTVVNWVYSMLFSVTPTLYGGAVPNSKMKDTAAALRDLAARIGSGAVTANDVAWLKGLETYLSGFDSALGSSYDGIPAATDAFAALMDFTSPNNLSALASANGDTQGVSALSNALAAMNALSAVMFPSGGSIAQLGAGVIASRIAPDVQAILDSKSPPIAPGVPLPGHGGGTPGGGGGGVPGGGGGGIPPKPAGYSTTAIVGGVVAVVALGALAYLLSTQHAAAAHPQLAKRNPMPRLRGRSATRNREGMTLVEWTRAANAFGTIFSTSNAGRERARKAWLRGEDPTEYAAHGRLIA